MHDSEECVPCLVCTSTCLSQTLTASLPLGLLLRRKHTPCFLTWFAFLHVETSSFPKIWYFYRQKSIALLNQSSSFWISRWWVTSWLFGLVMVTVGPMVGTGHAWVTFQPPSLPLFSGACCCIGHQWVIGHPTTHTHTFRPLHSYCNNPQNLCLSNPSLVKLNWLHLRPFLLPHKDLWSL